MARLRVGKSLWLTLGLLVLGLPLRWLLAAAVSILVHELCHYLAVRLCGGQVYGLQITAAGVTMHTSLLSPARQMVCALAGPIGGIVLFFAAFSFPRIAICALAHSAFNLLPVAPLDGGRAMESLLALLFPRMGAFIYDILQKILALVLLFVCLWACFVQKLGILPLFIGFGLLIKSDLLTNPCKAGRLAV